jgi:general secretion pathway protein A
MYKEFFGLQKLPFNLTPDPAFLFLPLKHREAFAGLTYAILDRKGFVVLTGDAGTGKTTILNSVLNRLPVDRVYSSIILNPTLTPSEFLESVLMDFGITDVPASKAQRLWKLQEFLALADHQGKVAVLVIDEAHKLSVEVLEEIRLLGNFENAELKFLQILLLGQSELDQVLDRQDLRQFKQRVALRLYIDPLATSEVEEYMRFRWSRAGGKEAPPFTPEAIKGISQWSGGIPRLVNSLCDTTLLMAYADASPTVGIEYVRKAAHNLAMVEVRSAPSAALAMVATASPPPINHASLTLVPQEPPTQPRTFPDLPKEEHSLPKMAPYGVTKPNSTLLRRLAEKFGLTH